MRRLTIEVNIVSIFQAFTVAMNQWSIFWKRLPPGVGGGRADVTIINQSSYTFSRLCGVFHPQQFLFKIFFFTQTCQRDWTRDPNHKNYGFDALGASLHVKTCCTKLGRVYQTSCTTYIFCRKTAKFISCYHIS
jgi:hypothetical protein